MSDDHLLNQERLKKITGSLIATITSPAVIEQMRQFREKAKLGGNFSDAGDLMSLESLRAAGADLPENFRITSRVFEDRETGQILQLEPSPHLGAETLRTASSNISGCAGGGAGTVCGCAGGGS